MDYPSSVKANPIRDMAQRNIIRLGGGTVEETITVVDINKIIGQAENQDVIKVSVSKNTTNECPVEVAGNVISTPTSVSNTQLLQERNENKIVNHVEPEPVSNVKHAIDKTLPSNNTVSRKEPLSKSSSVEKQSSSDSSASVVKSVDDSNKGTRRSIKNEAVSENKLTAKVTLVKKGVLTTPDSSSSVVFGTPKPNKTFQFKSNSGTKPVTLRVSLEKNVQFKKMKSIKRNLQTKGTPSRLLPARTSKNTKSIQAVSTPTKFKPNLKSKVHFKIPKFVVPRVLVEQLDFSKFRKKNQFTYFLRNPNSIARSMAKNVQSNTEGFRGAHKDISKKSTPTYVNIYKKQYKERTPRNLCKIMDFEEIKEKSSNKHISQNLSPEHSNLKRKSSEMNSNNQQTSQNQSRNAIVREKKEHSDKSTAMVRRTPTSDRKTVVSVSDSKSFNQKQLRSKIRITSTPKVKQQPVKNKQLPTVKNRQEQISVHVSPKRNTYNSTVQWKEPYEGYRIRTFHFKTIVSVLNTDISLIKLPSKQWCFELPCKPTSFDIKRTGGMSGNIVIKKYALQDIDKVNYFMFTRYQTVLQKMKAVMSRDCCVRIYRTGQYKCMKENKFIELCGAPKYVYSVRDIQILLQIIHDIKLTDNFIDIKLR